MQPILRLIEDVLANDAAVDLRSLPRMIFIVHGTLTIAGSLFGDGEAWHGEAEASLRAGLEGASCWRFELVADRSGDGAAEASGVVSREKISVPLETLPAGDLIMRGDSVAFPPGGCAYLHRHQGPGIRCLIEGGIRIDSGGRSTSYGPGGAWFENGPDPVFAQAAADRPSRFVRMLILPRAVLGRSSIEYLNAEDRHKPRSQQYKVLVDAPIMWRPALP